MKNYALITGGNSGLGFEIAMELASRGYSLLLVARNEATLLKASRILRNQYFVDVRIKVLDLAEDYAKDALMDWIEYYGFEISILINNAGFAIWDKFDKTSTQDHLKMIRVNQLFPVELTSALIPDLKRNAPSFILNVCSTTAYQAIPALSLYAASKSFMLSFSRGIAHELIRDGVSVTAVCPGAIKTGFIKNAHMERLENTANKFGMEASLVAKLAVQAMFDKKKEYIPGVYNKIGAYLSSYLPKSIIENVVEKIYQK